MCLIWVCQHNSAWKPCTNVLQIIRWKKNGHFCGQKCEIACKRLATVIDLKISMKQSALLLYQMCFVPKCMLIKDHHYYQKTLPQEKNAKNEIIM